MCAYIGTPFKREQYIGIAWGILFIFRLGVWRCLVEDNQTTLHAFFAFIYSVVWRDRADKRFAMELKEFNRKAIIAIVGKPNTGKTTALKTLISSFPFDNKPEYIWPVDDPNPYDVVCYGDFLNNGKKIRVGIATFGDMVDMQNEHMLPLITQNHCDVVVTACHNYMETRGNTYYNLCQVALEYNYVLFSTAIIRTELSNYKLHPQFADLLKQNESLLNSVFAQNTINLIKELTK